jgi:Ser/Thr protein kinase RdoA (MazF antagonist)
MEQAIKERFNEAILQAARERYGIAPDQIYLLDSFESFMYAFTRDGHPYILRLGHSRRRSVNLIRGEVEWINYLAAGGAGVARAVLSANGELVEVIDDGQGGHFLATAFVRAKGSPPGKEQWNEALFERYGRLIGRMHALSKTYQLPDPAWKRPEWDDPINMSIDWLPASESAALDKFQAVVRYLQSLPKDRDSYGLIHQDAHGGNFFVDEDGRITLFDFDDCVYGHFAYDLAMVLFYAVTNRPDAAEFAPYFWRYFMAGYRQENQLDPAWQLELPHFMKLREIDLYAVIYRSVGANNFENQWIANFMRGRKERIEQDAPYLDVDWSRAGGREATP